MTYSRHCNHQITVALLHTVDESCRHDVLQALQPGAGEVMSVAQESGVVSRSAPTVSRSTINNTAPTKVMTPNASRHPMACWNHG